MFFSFKFTLTCDHCLYHPQLPSALYPWSTSSIIVKLKFLCELLSCGFQALNATSILWWCWRWNPRWHNWFLIASASWEQGGRLEGWESKRGIVSSFLLSQSLLSLPQQRLSLWQQYFAHLPAPFPSNKPVPGPAWRRLQRQRSAATYRPTFHLQAYRRLPLGRKPHSAGPQRSDSQPAAWLLQSSTSR